MNSMVAKLILVALVVACTGAYSADAKDKPDRPKEVRLDADTILGTFDKIPVDFVRKKVKAKILKKFDTDSSGAIDAQEEREKLVSYFRNYDSDQNDVLSKTEFRKAMESLKEKSGGKCPS